MKAPSSPSTSRQPTPGCGGCLLRNRSWFPLFAVAVGLVAAVAIFFVIQVTRNADSKRRIAGECSERGNAIRNELIFALDAIPALTALYRTRGMPTQPEFRGFMELLNIKSRHHYWSACPSILCSDSWRVAAGTWCGCSPFRWQSVRSLRTRRAWYVASSSSGSSSAGAASHPHSLLLLQRILERNFKPAAPRDSYLPIVNSYIPNYIGLDAMTVDSQRTALARLFRNGSFISSAQVVTLAPSNFSRAVVVWYPVYKSTQLHPTTPEEIAAGIKGVFSAVVLLPPVVSNALHLLQSADIDIEVSSPCLLLLLVTALLPPPLFLVLTNALCSLVCADRCGT